MLFFISKPYLRTKAKSHKQYQFWDVPGSATLIAQSLPCPYLVLTQSLPSPYLVSRFNTEGDATQSWRKVRCVLHDDIVELNMA